MSSRLMWIMKPVMQPWRVTDRKKKKLPERGIALSKWVIEYCDKGNQIVQLKSKLPLLWWNWTLLLEKHPHAHETMHTNKRESQIKVAVGRMNSENELWRVKYRGHWIDFVFWNFRSTYWKYIGLLGRMDRARPRKRKVEGTAPGNSNFILPCLLFPNFFFKFFLQKHMFFLFLSGTFPYFWAEIGIREADYQSTAFVFPFTHLEKGEVLIIPECSSSISWLLMIEYSNSGSTKFKARLKNNKM